MLCDNSYEVAKPSHLMFGVSSPDLLETSSTWAEYDTAEEWTQLQYLEYVLEQAWMEIVPGCPTWYQSTQNRQGPKPQSSTPIDRNTLP